MEHAPVAYQDVNGTQQAVSSHFVLLAGNEVSISVGAYDRSKPLVIDPQWVYSSYLGGAGEDMAYGIAMANGATPAAYIVGFTTSPWTPAGTTTTTFPNGGTPAGSDVFVAKVSGDGKTLFSLSYLVGSGRDVGYGITVDSNDNAYITGLTTSANFPLVNAWQTQLGGKTSNAFVAELTPDLSKLTFSTYLGGANWTEGRGIVVDATTAHHIDVVGTTLDPGGVVGPFDPNNHKIAPTTFGKLGGDDVFVAQLTNTGQLQNSNYLAFSGGTGSDEGTAITFDSQGNVYITGETASKGAGTAFPTTANAFQTDLLGGVNVFAEEIAFPGNGAPTQVYSTYFGGAGNDYGTGIALDPSPDKNGNANDVYIVGYTTTPSNGGFGLNGKLKPTVVLGANTGSPNAFVARFDLHGDPKTLPYFVYLTSAGKVWGKGIALTHVIGGSTKLYITGMTSADPKNGGFPILGAMRGKEGLTDAYVALLDPSVAGQGRANALSKLLLFKGLHC